MERFAEIHDGVVISVRRYAPGREPEDCVPAPVGIGPGYLYDGETFTPPTMVEETPTPDGVLAYAAGVIREGTWFTVAGVGDIRVSGADYVQKDLHALATAAQVLVGSGDTTTTLPFRDSTGVIYQLTGPQVLDLFMQGVTWVASRRQTAWALSVMDPIPQDYKNASYWDVQT
jgi:hypothetical protein